MASGAVEGAKAGAAFGPWGAAIGGAAGLASDAMGGAFMGGSAEAKAYGTSFDNSGWAVNIGSGSPTQSSTPTRTGAPPEAIGISGMSPAAPGFTAGGGITGILLLVLCVSILLKRGAK